MIKERFYWDFLTTILTIFEWKAAADGTMYRPPTKTAQPSIYDPLAEYQSIVLDAISIGRMEAQKNR